MSQGLIKASHDGVREKYRLRERGGGDASAASAALHHSQYNVPQFYVSIGLTQRANRLVYMANVEELKVFAPVCNVTLFR